MASKGSQALFRHRSICNRNKSMTVSDNTEAAEGLGDFFESLGKKGVNASEKMAKNFLQKLGRVLKVGANVATAFASRCLKQFYQPT